MRMAWGGRGWCGLLAVLCATGGARAYEPDVTFKSFVVLPATTEDAKKLPDWQLGWHYLVQERMREMPGIQVFRFEDAAELVEQFQAGKLDVTTIANRNLIAQRFGADLVIALSYKRGGDEGWEVSASLIDPTAGPKPVAEIPAASGRSPSAVVDQLVIAILKTALSEKVVGLPPYETEVTDLGEFDRLARVVTLWPYCRKADAARGQLEKALEVLTRVIRGAKLGLLYQRYTYCHIAGTKGAAWITPVMAWAQQRTQRDARSNLVYGEALAATGDDLKAADYLSKAANLSRGGLPAVCALADCYRRQGKIDLALGQFDSALKLWPNVLAFKLIEGEMALDHHQPDVAVRAFQTAVMQAPKSLAAGKGLVRALLQANRPADAFKAAKDLAAAGPDDVDSLALLAQSALAVGEFDSGKAAAARVAAERPKDAAAQGVLGEIALGLKDAATAEKAFAAAVQLEPKKFEHYRHLAEARVLAEPANYTGAVDAMQASLKVAPDVERPGLLQYLAEILLSQGKHDEAVKAAQDAAALVPKDATPRYQQARIWLYKGDLTKSLEAYRAALELDALAAGPGQQVLAEFEQLEKDGRGFTNLRLVMGYLYQAAGRNREARRKYNEYLNAKDSAPMQAWVKDRLAELSAAGAGAVGGAGGNG